MALACSSPARWQQGRLWLRWECQYAAAGNRLLAGCGGSATAHGSGAQLDQRARLQLPLGSDLAARRYRLRSAGGIIPPLGDLRSAGASAAACFSVMVMKSGCFWAFSRYLLGGNAPLWWNVALLVAGMITACRWFVRFGLEHNIQRLLTCGIKHVLLRCQTRRCGVPQSAGADRAGV